MFVAYLKKMKVKTVAARATSEMLTPTIPMIFRERDTSSLVWETEHNHHSREERMRRGDE